MSTASWMAALTVWCAPATTRDRVVQTGVTAGRTSEGPADGADFDADETRIQPEILSDPDLICGEVSVICGPFPLTATVTLDAPSLNLAIFFSSRWAMRASQPRLA